MDFQNIRLFSLSTALGFISVLEDEEVLIMKSKREHRYWMAPYLKDRSNPYQRNTLAKLEMDFLRVSPINLILLYLFPLSIIVCNDITITIVLYSTL